MSEEQIGLTDQQKAEIKSRLEELAKHDRKAVALFASRCALRVFPLLAQPYNNAFFGYWQEQDRAKHLLAVYRALLISVLQGPHNGSIDAARTAARSDSEGGRFARADAAAYASYAVVYNSDSPAADIAVADSAFYAATSATDFIISARISLFKLWDQDLTLLEEKGAQALEQAPLWLDNKVSEEYRVLVEKHLPDALRQLVEQSQQSDPQAAEIIQQIYPLYRGIYEGNPDKRAITHALDQLDGYFERLDNPDIPQFEDQFHGSSLHNRHDLAKEDKLNREQLVNSLATVLLEPGNSGHQTIGLLGHWGSNAINLRSLLVFPSVMAASPLRTSLSAKGCYALPWAWMLAMTRLQYEVLGLS